MPLAIVFLSADRWSASVDGYTAFGSSPVKAVGLLYRLIAWHDAPDGWRSTLAWWRLRYAYH